LASAHFTQLKSQVLVISRSNNYDKKNASPISQITIDYPGSIENNTYECSAENASVHNIGLWNKDSIDPDKTGVLIYYYLDKSICKQLYYQITTSNILDSLKYKIGLMYHRPIDNGLFIRFRYQHLLKDNEPENDYTSFNPTTTEEDASNEDDDDDDAFPSDSPSDSPSPSASPSVGSDLDNVVKWDVEVSDVYTEALIVAVSPIIEHASTVREDNVLNIYQHKQYRDMVVLCLLQDDGKEHLIHDKFHDTRKKRIEWDAAKRVEYRATGKIKVSLAHNEDWLKASEHILSSLGLKVDTRDSKENNAKLDVIKRNTSGNMYFRNNILFLKYVPPAITQGTFKPRIIHRDTRCVIEFDANLDNLFGVTVIKFSLSEDIVDKEIRKCVDVLRKAFQKKIFNIDVEEVIAKSKPIVSLPKPLLTTFQFYDESEDDACVSDSSSESSISDKNENENVMLETFDKEGESAEEGYAAKEERGEVEDVVVLPKPEYQPNVVSRKSNRATYLTREEVTTKLNYWLSKEEFHDELAIELRSMCQKYLLINRYVIDIVLVKMSLTDQVNMIISYLNQRYVVEPANGVDFGADFGRAYNEVFRNGELSSSDNESDNEAAADVIKHLDLNR